MANLHANPNEMRRMAAGFDNTADQQHTILNKASALVEDLTNGSYKGAASEAEKAEFLDAYKDVQNYLNNQADPLGDNTRTAADNYEDTDEGLASDVHKRVNF